MPNSKLPTDPLFSTQWGLLNTGQQGGVPGIDINVVPVLGTGTGQVTGKGVRVAVIDDGTELKQADLAPNIDVASSYDAVLDTSGNGSGNPNSPTQNHGTAVAGIIAAASNTIGTTGVAPQATLVIERIPLGQDDPLYDDPDSAYAIPSQVQAYQNAFEHALRANVDVDSNSWGSSEPFSWNTDGLGQAFDATLEPLATEGRAGKGISTVVANGNDRTKDANGTLDGFKSSRFAIAVAALDSNGVVSSYSTAGSNLLVSAPAGASTSQRATVPGNGIATTDRTGSLGYNDLPSPNGDVTFDFNGTSAATPFVSGVIALMLQANPGLGYRDVQQILAITARQTDRSAESWITNGATGVNGGGLHFSNDYGFGLVDAHAAVRLAQSWSLGGAAPLTEANITSQTAANTPDAPATIGSGLQKTFVLGVGEVEHIYLDLGLTVADTNKLQITLTSPSGTKVVLSPYQNSKGAAWPTVAPRLGSDAFWGEQSAGTWRLSIQPLPGSPNAGTFNSATLTSWGASSTAAFASNAIFTDDYALMAQGQPARATITAGPGPGTFNAAATSGSVVLDLQHGVGAIGGTAFSVASGTSFATVIGGDGGNQFFGDAADHTFVTGHGQTTVVTGAGNNQVLSMGQDTIFAGSGATAVVGAGSMLVLGGVGAALVAGSGADTMFGGAGGGSFFAGKGGGSVLVGGSGSSTLVGGGDGDTLFATGTAGTQLVAGSGNETLFGGLATGNNVFFGGSGNDVIVGGAGNDTIFGGSGAATVDGGAGSDLLVFVNGKAGGSVVVNNFNAAAGSRVTLQGYAAGEAAQDLLAAVRTDAGTTVTLSDNTRVTFTGLQLSASMFV